MSFSQPVAGESSAAPSRHASDLPQHQIDAIIRTKRKARQPKACYPCHARKVKCDRNQPCDGCVKRDHADLCSYERPSKKRFVADSIPESYSDGMHGETIGKDEPIDSPIHDDFAHPHEPTFYHSRASSSGGVTIAREEWDNVRNRLKEMEKTMFNLRMQLDKADDAPGPAFETNSVHTADGDNSSAKGASPEREGIHAANTLGEGTVHLGSRSVLAYILNSKSGSDQVQALLEGGILPKLGLDNESATYPFVDLWSSDMSSFDISAVCSALPNDQQCKQSVFPCRGCHMADLNRLFYYYRDIAGAIYPVLEDLDAFEMNLDMLLQSRAATDGMYREGDDATQKPFGMTVAYLGLLFAVLASGCQSSDLPSKERELTSQVYGRLPS